jgi:isoamylase
MNANDGLCADWICDCLRYWVSEMHVDGFRFDLASALCRGGDGKIQHQPHLIKKMVNDPVLKRAKLIAEPWDCSWPDGYLCGRFPSCGPARWAEWNGMWRDAVRRFIKGDPCMKSDFATRMCGSSDLFRQGGRSPFHSVNFITAHDGFTLYDLVSYNGKQNFCNGEDSGDDHNNSWNCGHEGHTGDGAITHLRDRQMRNFMVALFLSLGTPMMVFGDEYGRTQHGCNNGWCQDKLSWFSWDGCVQQESRLFRFCRLLINFRKRHSRVFCRDRFLSEKDIWWRTYWEDDYNYICYILHDNHDGKYDGILIAFNAGHEMRSCDLPPKHEWYRIIDTNLPSPKDIAEDDKSATKISGGSYTLHPRSCIVLKTFSDKASAYDAEEADYQNQQRLEDHLGAIAQRRMSMEFRIVSRQSFSRLVSDEEAEEEWQRTVSQSLMKRQSMMSGCILELTGADGQSDFVVERPPANGGLLLPPSRPLKEPAKPGAKGPAVQKQEPRAEPARTEAAAFSPAERRPETSAAPSANGKASSVEAIFEVTCQETVPGEGVFVVGSSPALGAWNPAKGLLLTTTAEAFPVWSSKAVSVDAAAEFKVVVQNVERRGGARWEGGDNKRLQAAGVDGAGPCRLACGWGSPEVSARKA